MATERPNAFKITDTSRAKTWTVAADNARDCENWVRALANIVQNVVIPEESEEEPARPASFDVMLSTGEVVPLNKTTEQINSSRQQAPSKSRDNLASKISQPNPEQDVMSTMSPRERATKFLQLTASDASSVDEIPSSELEDLVLFIDPKIDGHRVANYFRRYFQVASSDLVHIDFFIEWWNKINLNRSETLKSSIKVHEENLKFYVNGQSWIESSERLDELLWGASVDPPTKSTGVKLRPRSLLFTYTAPRQSKAYFLADLFKAYIPYLETVTVQWPCDYEGSWNDAYQHYIDLAMESSTSELVDHRDSSNQAVSSHFSLFSLRGKFTAFAMECVKQIIDEIALPDALKTIRQLKVPSISDEIYAINGMVIRLINDQLTNQKAVSKSGVVSNDMKRAMCSHDRSSAHWIEAAVASGGQESQLSSFRVPLSEVIDYCGFRFHVYADMHTTEAQNLVHGFSYSEAVFINSEPMVDNQIPILAHHLGMISVPRLLPSRTVRSASAKSDKFKVGMCAVHI